MIFPKKFGKDQKNVMAWYWVKLKNACGGIKTDGGIIVKVPPIWKYWKDQNIGDFYNWYQHKGELIEIKPIEDK